MPETPVRIQRRRTKGSRLQSPNGLPVVCVTRPSKWGNPFKVGVHGSAGECVALFREWLKFSPEGRRMAREAKGLRGKNVACFCAVDKPCHGDVWLEVANHD